MVEFEVNSRTQLMMEKAKEKQREGVHCLQFSLQNASGSNINGLGSKDH